MRPFALTAFLAASAVAGAQIVLKPAGGDAVELTPRTVDVKAKVKAGVATSVWTYAFANNARWEGQADFLIAIPKGGVVGGFAYWYQGKKVFARITEKDRAKRIYNAIVARQRDPALIELVGKNTFRVRVFPIDAAADLKVEITMAQAIPAGPRGATLTIPLKSLGKLEKATVAVEGDGKLQTSWGGLNYANANSKAPDLKVTQAWERRALHASLRAARSGGPGGFFALTLTPSKAVKGRRWRLEGPVEDVIEVKGRGDSVLLVGRYRKPGKVRAWLVGNGYGAHEDLVLPDTIEPNGPATKLWAWNKIGRSKDRKETVALSLRHGVPSRFTSWIAIPDDERKRMAREIAQADLANDVARVMPTLRKVGVFSPRGRAIIAKMKARARELGVDPQEIWDEKLAVEAEALAHQWEAAFARRGEESPQARRLLAQIDAFGALGIRPYTVVSRYGNVARTLAPLVLEDRLARRQDAASRRREARLAQASARTGRRADAYLQSIAYRESRESAQAVVRAERKGETVPQARARVLALGRATGRDPEAILREARGEVAEEAYGGHIAALAKEILRDEPDPAALRREADAFRKEKAIMAANGRTTYSEGWFFSQRAEKFAQKVAAGTADAKDLAKEQATIERLAKAANLPVQLNWPGVWEQTYYQVRPQRDALLNEARRDRPALKKADAAVQRVEPFIGKEFLKNFQSWGYNTEKGHRADYLAARRRGESGDEPLAKLYQEDVSRPWSSDGGNGRPGYTRQQWARDRQARLRALTELDQLDGQKADPAVLARKQELTARANELRARMGDPIVRIDAPGARSVVARMPDGAWLTLHPAADGRWEGRFDVPAGVVDGRYEIAVYVDGALATKVPINVDTAAPKVKADWQGGRVEVLTDDDVRRVTGLTPGGERLELVREGLGRFSTLAPEGTRFVATDGAHNRSDQRGMGFQALSPEAQGQDAPGTHGLEAHATTWLPGITALARVGGRLWAGTANDGGGYEGAPRDEARPWVKAAVAVGGRLAVRHADGTVTLDGEPLKTARHSTAIAADGETLLVGTIGGYFDAGRPVFPAELAGVVVTALLGDGERVWLGTQGRGIAEVDRARGTVRWHDERNGLGDDWVTCLGFDGKGRVLAGTFVAGAFVFEGGWQSLSETSGTCVTGVGGGWVATRQGVFRDGRLVDPVEATAFLLDGGTAWIGTRTGTGRLSSLEPSVVP